MEEYELNIINNLLKTELNENTLLKIKKMVECQIETCHSIKRDVLTNRQSEVLLDNLLSNKSTEQ